LDIKGSFSVVLFFSSSKVDIAIYQKINRKNELLAKHPTFEWCAFLKGKKTMLERYAFIIFRHFFPELSKKCPMSGHYEYFNLKLGKQYFRVGPDGIYRVTVKVTDGERGNHAYLEGELKIEE
jgi:hypothetical protein